MSDKIMVCKSELVFAIEEHKVVTHPVEQINVHLGSIMGVTHRHIYKLAFPRDSYGMNNTRMPAAMNRAPLT